MLNPLVAKLEHYVRLSTGERTMLNALSGNGLRSGRARDDIAREGEPPHNVKLLLQGWACRYKMLEDGRRQIIAFFLPGDLCDLNVYILAKMDHSIAAVTDVRYVELSRDQFDTLTEGHPRITQALWWESLVTAAIQREWTVNLGQRSAIERLAHLFCELFVRLRGVGLTDGDSCDLPLTQAELAEATGLTAVHVNRTVQDLRARGLITLKSGRLTLHDFDQLRDLALFNPNYLHLEREGRRFDAND